MSVCFYCGGLGHNPAFCPQAKKDKSNKECAMASLRINMGGQFNAETAQAAIINCTKVPCCSK